jgi:hypothetical protein
MKLQVRTALIAGCVLVGSSAALAATGGALTTIDNPGGGRVLSAGLGQTASLRVAAGAMLSRIHSVFGTRPAVVQVVQNAAGHSLALLFTERRDGRSYTGVSLITVAQASPASGVALYDTSDRFPRTVNQLLKLYQGATARAMTTATAQHPARLNPAEPLVQQQWPDGTGTIGVPADWSLKSAGGGSALAVGPSGDEIAAFNSAQSAMDPTYGIGSSLLAGNADPRVRRHTLQSILLLPHIADPVKAWTTTFDQMAIQNGKTGPHFVATKVTRTGDDTAMISGTGVGNKHEPIFYIAYVRVDPVNRIGQWGMKYSYVIVPKDKIVKDFQTAFAVLASARINAQAFAVQGQAIREAQAQRFNAEIASDRAQDAVRLAGTERAIANDQATQDAMQKEAVGMEHYSLDEAVVMHSSTGTRGTVDNSFAQTLVRDDPNYRIVPPSEFIKGVDY